MREIPELVAQKEGHLFRCHFFTQSLDPHSFTLHEEYYLINGGEVFEFNPRSMDKTGDSPTKICVHGEDLGVWDQQPRQRQHYDIDVRKLKELFPARK